MAQKKDDLPVNVDVDLQNGGTITYATEVISTIAGVAANEIEGIAGMCISGGLSDIIGRNRNVTRGVKVEIGSEEASFDLYVIVEYGQPIQKVCHDVQENVRKAIESMTGLHVVRVDVHVQGVSFEKEKQQTEINIEAAKSPALTAGTPAPKESAGEAKPQKAKKKKKQAPKKEKAPEAEAAPEDASPDAAEETPAPAEESAPVEKITEQAPEDGEIRFDEALEASPEAEAETPAQEEAAENAEASGDECAEEPEEDALSWMAGPVAGGYRETAVDASVQEKGGKKRH